MEFNYNKSKNYRRGLGTQYKKTHFSFFPKLVFLCENSKRLKLEFTEKSAFSLFFLIIGKMSTFFSKLLRLKPEF